MSDDNPLGPDHSTARRFARWTANGFMVGGTIGAAILGAVAALIAAWIGYVQRFREKSN